MERKTLNNHSINRLYDLFLNKQQLPAVRPCFFLNSK